MQTPKPSSPAYCQGYLERRWAEGCKIGRQLLSEIQRLGYTGSLSHLERLLTQWRAAGSDRLAMTPAPADPLPAATDPATRQFISQIIAAALRMKPRSLLTSRQAGKVQALKDASPDFVAMRRFAMRFRGIMQSGDIDKLTTWIDDVRCSYIYAMQTFGSSLLQDLDAVRNAMTEPWSNGQTEGQINRLKTLKQPMYGRAGVELLRDRIAASTYQLSHRLRKSQFVNVSRALCGEHWCEPLAMFGRQATSRRGALGLSLAAWLALGAWLAPHRTGAQALVLQGSTTFDTAIMAEHRPEVEKLSGESLTVLANKSNLGLQALLDHQADLAMISTALQNEVDC